MCLELALEGERLCKAGDCKAGVAFFQAAIQAGTDDLRTLSAIYSQLGNAYFYLGDYGKAMQYHKHDLTLARYMSAVYVNHWYSSWNDLHHCLVEPRLQLFIENNFFENGLLGIENVTLKISTDLLAYIC